MGIIKNLFKNLNALYIKMIVKPNLEKLYKKSLPIIPMKQSEMILQGIFSLDYLNIHVSYGFKKMVKSD